MSVNILGKTYNIEKTISLDLSNKGLTSLPVEIGKLINLQYLYLNCNRLTCLPSEIGNLTNLRFLNLSKNSLMSLPPEIGNLTNLRRLYLEHNSLTSLPSEIGNLTSLEYLISIDNSLTSLPSEIGNLTSLKKLYLYTNSITKLPTEILKIKNKLGIDERSYEINNMDPDTEFIILSRLKTKITNLPFNLKEIWLKEGVDDSLIKVPFGCEVKYFL